MSLFKLPYTQYPPFLNFFGIITVNVKTINYSCHIVIKLLKRDYVLTSFPAVVSQ